MSSSQVEEVRARADIVRIIGEHVKLRKAGANFVGLCPFHQEKTPSFNVHASKQIFHCFGCGVGGDVFKFIMLIERISFPEALERVAERVGVKVQVHAGSAPDRENARAREALLAIYDVATKFYASQLAGTSEGRAARGYLADRGMSDQAVGRFRIGYAPADGQALTRRLVEERFAPETVEKSGLLLRDQNGRAYDRFRRRIIFPIAHENGKVVAFGGRALGDDHPKYMNSPETPIYSKSRTLYNLDRAGAEIRKREAAVLVEGYMDAIAAASAGVENVVASCGTSLTESQARLLGRYARRVIVNFDPDSAGMAATERSLNLFLEEGFEVKVLALSGGLDPDGFIRASGAEAYRELVRAAVSYLDYLTDRAAARHDVRTPEGKVAAANDVLPYLAHTPNPLLRAERANRLASRLGLDDRLLREELNRTARSGATHIASTSSFQLLPAFPAEKLLLQTFLERPELAREFLAPLVESGFVKSLASERIFHKMAAIQQDGGTLKISALEESLNEDEKRLIYQSAFELAPLADGKEVSACIQALERKKLERESEKIQGEIKNAQETGDSARLADLMREKSRIFKEMLRLRGSPQFPD